MLLCVLLKGSMCVVLCPQTYIYMNIYIYINVCIYIYCWVCVTLYIQSSVCVAFQCVLPLSWVRAALCVVAVGPSLIVPCVSFCIGQTQDQSVLQCVAVCCSVLQCV